MNMPHIASQIIGTPLLMHQAKLDNIMTVFGPRIASGIDFSAAIQAEEIQHRVSADYVVADGVAIIPVIGSLVHRGRSMNSSGMTAYQALDANLTMAMNDASVNSILLDIDSPGGQVSGCFDFADSVLNMRGNKKIVAVANDLCASAAYAIGSAADELVVTQTAQAGSIGVVMAHVDYSANLEKSGIAVTYVYAGDSKVSGNPYEPLPSDVKAEMQEEINGIYQLFTNHVATARGLNIKDVIGTQARVFTGQKAVSAGLADRVGTLESEFARLKAQNPKSSAGSRRFATRNSEVSMSDPTEKAGSLANVAAAAIATGAATAASQPAATSAAPAPAPAPAATVASAQTAVSEITEAEFSAALATAAATATSAERSRCMGIMQAGKDLSLADSVLMTQISTGASLATANQVMISVKEGIDASVAIDTQHTAGATVGKVADTSLNVADIYAARNAR